MPLAVRRRLDGILTVKRGGMGDDMGSQVALPLWAVIILTILAALAVIDRILLPSVRWALRRRANRAIDELNTRLKLRIQPFKLTGRQVMTDRLVFDPEVLHAADEYAREAGVPREVAMEKVKRYANEIVPSFSAYAYFRIGTRLARGVSRCSIASASAIATTMRWQRWIPGPRSSSSSITAPTWTTCW